MEFITTNASQAFGTLLIIVCAVLVTIVVSGYLKTWITAITAVRLIANLQSSNSEYAERSAADQKAIEELKDQKEILKRQVAFEKAQLVHREETIKGLMRDITWREEKIKILTDRMRDRERAVEEFNRRLLKYLAFNFSTGPEDIERELGINSDGELLSTKKDPKA